MSNIEPLAREICARRLATQNADDLPALVDRYWPVVAAMIEAGLITDDGRPVLHDHDVGLAAYQDWLARHGKH